MCCHRLLAFGVLLGFLPEGRHVAQTAWLTFTPLNVPFADTRSTEVVDINGRGQIVGPYVDLTEVHGFLATPKRKVRGVR
jgi:hypothetical protein